MSLRKAIQVACFGGPEVLQLRNIPIPSVNNGQVLVRLHAVGVNPVDTYIRTGTTTRKPSLPYVPGSDGAGVVQSVASDVTAFKAGDCVYVHNLTGSGTYTELTVCNQDNVFKLPPSLSFSQGTALGVPYLTAYRALFQKLKVKKDEILFVHGASGGVGMAAVQIAKAHGLCVFGTASTEDGKKVVLDAGAHEVFNHKEKGYLDKVMAATKNRGADAILENLANVNLASDMGLVANNGRIVVVGNRGSIEVNPREIMVKELCVMGVALFKATIDEIHEATKNFEKWAEEGWLRPIVGKTYKLSEAAEAHKEIIHGAAKGKLVLEMD